MKRRKHAASIVVSNQSLVTNFFTPSPATSREPELNDNHPCESENELGLTRLAELTETQLSSGAGSIGAIIPSPNKRGPGQPHPTFSAEPTESQLSTSIVSDSISVITGKKATRRKFQMSWLDSMKWLKYDPSTGEAKCEICSAFPSIGDSTSRVVQGFYAPFKLETFKKHAKSLQHLKCVEAVTVLHSPSTAPLARCLKKMDEKMFDHLKTVFTACYYIAKNNKPFSDLQELLLLIRKCDHNAQEEITQYSNRFKCKEFISHIASVIRHDLVMELKGCPFVSLLLDSSSDKSGVEELILNVRYLKDNKVKESFLSIVPLEDSSASGYLKTIRQELKSMDLEDCMKGKSLVGVGTDGASTMIGSKNGLVTLLGKEEGCDHLISVHCLAHRLNLSVLSSVKGVKYIEEIDACIKKLYQFFHYSPRRMRKLKEIAKLLESEIVKFQYLHNVRWVASKVSALTALLKDWKCVVVYLESIAEGQGDDASTAKGLLKKLKDFRFVATVHFLKDYLGVFQDISLIFQRENLLLSSVSLHVSKGLAALECLRTKPGPMEEMLINNTSLKGVFQEIQLNAIANTAYNKDKEHLLDAGIHYLRERFSSKHSQVADATSVFDTFTWPKGKCLESFGDAGIDILCQHFRRQLKVCSSQKIINEWYEFKVLGQGLNLSDLIDRALSMKERFPILSQLLSIVAVLPTSTAACERGFSVMNLIKNKFRASMEIESLKDLMTVYCNGPSLEDFNPEKAVDHWYFCTSSTRHIHGHKTA